MSNWLIISVAIYAIGFALIIVLHLLALPMVTPALGLLRALVWPIWLITGWPHGTSLPMD